MKKFLCSALALLLALSFCAAALADGYTIRIYSNSNSSERVTWLKNVAKQAGFEISLDDSTVYKGDTSAIQLANENKDADVIFGLNEVRWSQLVNNGYENLRVIDWTPCHGLTKSATINTTARPTA